MSRFKLGIVAAIAVVTLCLFVGCSADALMKTGKTLGKLGSAGFGTEGDEHVAGAADSVKGFIEGYEDCIIWDGSCKRNVDPNTGKETITGDLRRNPESKATMYNLLGDVISKIQKAKDSKADDSELRKAIETLYKDYDGEKKSYTGQTIEWFGHLNIKDILDTMPDIGNVITRVFPSGYDLTKVYSVNIPFPIQGSELATLISYLFDNMGSILSHYLGLSAKIKRAGGGGSNFKIEDLKYIQDGVKNHVNGRSDPTVGDKITFCILYDIVDSAITVLNRYVKLHPDEDQDHIFDDLNAGWILGNCSDELDRIMVELEAIAYIYDFNLDVAGLVGKILGN